MFDSAGHDGKQEKAKISFRSRSELLLDSGSPVSVLSCIRIAPGRWVSATRNCREEETRRIETTQSHTHDKEYAPS